MFMRVLVLLIGLLSLEAHASEFYKCFEIFENGKCDRNYLKTIIRVEDRDNISAEAFSFRYWTDIDGYVLTHSEYSTRDKTIANVTVGTNLISFSIDLLGRYMNITVVKLDKSKEWTDGNVRVNGEGTWEDAVTKKAAKLEWKEIKHLTLVPNRVE